ncbi:MAG: WD40 repeat domain-containing protein [Streptosporangiaceae bacterium]
MAFSPDGTLLATTGEDRMIQLWDVATAKTARTLTGHTNRCTKWRSAPTALYSPARGSDRTARL